MNENVWLPDLILWWYSSKKYWWHTMDNNTMSCRINVEHSTTCETLNTKIEFIRVLRIVAGWGRSCALHVAYIIHVCDTFILGITQVLNSFNQTTCIVIYVTKNLEISNVLSISKATTFERKLFFYPSGMNSNVSDYTTIRCYKIMAGAKKDHHLICDPKKDQRFHFIESYEFHFLKPTH